MTTILPPPVAAPAFTGSEDFGPDTTKTAGDKLPPKINQKNPPKASPLSNLGGNTKARSPIRRLNDDDEKTLADWYRRAAKIARKFRPELADALEEQADDCAHTWCELAATNDKVRRMILGVIEGGEWGKVMAAHTPIIMAVLPASVIEKIVLRGFALFARSTEDTYEDHYPMAQAG